ncbi:hypothetical protein WR25_07636 [Diploscapter pachys]|uniref:Uncharacterized protein n=1 Tax=Diploscapter pachys TaxID=2018661 RepID=A0A2A2KY88_9BILA|nr:hypothetical protein WR25_07636 [Diploscapter pachys]
MNSVNSTNIGERRFKELNISLIIKRNDSSWRGSQFTNGNRQLIINSASGISRTHHNYGVVFRFGENKKATFKQIEKNKMITKEDIKFTYRSI